MYADSSYGDVRIDIPGCRGGMPGRRDAGMPGRRDAGIGMLFVCFWFSLNAFFCFCLPVPGHFSNILIDLKHVLQASCRSDPVARTVPLRRSFMQMPCAIFRDQGVLVQGVLCMKYVVPHTGG